MASFNRLAADFTGSGRQIEDDYLGRLRAFDAQEGLRTATEGAVGDFHRQLRESLTDLRGQHVAMGRLRSGFATEDENQVVTDLGSRLQDRIAQMALQAQGQQMENTRSLGQFGMGRTQQGLEMMTSQRQWDHDRQMARRQGRSNLISGGLQLVGTVAGGALGGPIGAAIGNRFGAAAGGG